MLIRSLIVVIGAAFAIPAPRQLIVHGPESHDALDIRGSDWDGVLEESGEEVEGPNRLKFIKRANELINLMMEKRSEERSTNTPSSQDPYGTGIRFDKDVGLTLRETKPPARIQAFGTPVRGGDPVSGRNANADGDNIWIPDAKPPARFEANDLPAHDGRSLVEERDPPPGHIGKGALGEDFPITRQEHSAEAISWKGQNKSWKKSNGNNWLRTPGSDKKRRNNPDAGENGWAQDWIRITTPGKDEKARNRRNNQNNGRGQDWSTASVKYETSQSKRQEGSAGEIDWGRQAYGIDSAEDETDSVRITRKLSRVNHDAAQI